MKFKLQKSKRRKKNSKLFHKIKLSRKRNLNRRINKQNKINNKFLNQSLLQIKNLRIHRAALKYPKIKINLEDLGKKVFCLNQMGFRALEIYLLHKLHKIKVLIIKIKQTKTHLEIILAVRTKHHSLLLITRINFHQNNHKTYLKINRLLVILNFSLHSKVISFQDNNRTIFSHRIIFHFLKISRKQTAYHFLKINLQVVQQDFKISTKISSSGEDNSINLEIYNSKTMECLKIKKFLLKIAIKILHFNSL